MFQSFMRNVDYTKPGRPGRPHLSIKLVESPMTLVFQNFAWMEHNL